MRKHSRHPGRLHLTADNCPHAVLPAHSIDSADMRIFENVRFSYTGMSKGYSIHSEVNSLLRFSPQNSMKLTLCLSERFHQKEGF